MKLFRWLSLAIVFTLLVGCATGNGNNPTITSSASPTSSLPTPIVGITHAPNANSAIYGFLDALKGNDYAGMYALLDKASQAAITQDDFALRYRESLNTMSAASLDYEVGAVIPSPSAAQAPFHLTYHSALAGDIARDFIAPLNLEDGQWRIAWTPELILPELAGGNRLALDCKAPTRGDIFDRNGDPIVSTTEAVALGVNTGNVNFNTLITLTTELWRVTGVNPEALANQIIGSGPGCISALAQPPRRKANAC